MHCSLYGRVAHIADLLSLQLPRDYSTRAASFPPHFSFHSLLHTLRKLPWPPSTLGIVKWARVVIFRYPTSHEVVVKSSLATNLSRCQALFVPGNHCSSVFWCSARHAFLHEKIEKIQYLPWHKVVCCVSEKIVTTHAPFFIKFIFIFILLHIINVA